MSASEIQGWIAVVGGLTTAVVGILGFLNYRTRRDYFATVGESFSSTVDALSDQRLTKQMAAAVLLRRFFDPQTEQGRRGSPYRLEAVNVIAGMLREDQNARLQKALADGLRYARVLTNFDLQQCNLKSAYLGQKKGDDWVLDLSEADLFEANLDGASLKNVTAERAVFYFGSLKRTVFEGAVLTEADFRAADLTGAKFAGARIGGARFEGANGIPPEVADLLDERQIAPAGAKVPEPEDRS
jgi:Pentapeptide repeats (8 copies)